MNLNEILAVFSRLAYTRWPSDIGRTDPFPIQTVHQRGQLRAVQPDPRRTNLRPAERRFLEPLRE
jgi:hypothetical protein